MIDLLKKTVLAGIGATVVTKDLVERKLGELVEKGKITSQEACDMASKIAEEGRKEFEQSKIDASRMFDDMLRKAHLARQKDVDALAARVAALEAQAALAAVESHKPPSII